jgi:hypothetical protein
MRCHPIDGTWYIRNGSPAQQTPVADEPDLVVEGVAPRGSGEQIGKSGNAAPARDVEVVELEVEGEALVHDAQPDGMQQSDVLVNAEHVLEHRDVADQVVLVEGAEEGDVIPGSPCNPATPDHEAEAGIAFQDVINGVVEAEGGATDDGIGGEGHVAR